MNIFLSFLLGFSFFGLVIPFFTGVALNTWERNTSDPWYKQLYFRWFPMVVGALLGIGFILLAVYVLGRDILNTIIS